MCEDKKKEKIDSVTINLENCSSNIQNQGKEIGGEDE